MPTCYSFGIIYNFLQCRFLFTQFGLLPFLWSSFQTDFHCCILLDNNMLFRVHFNEFHCITCFYFFKSYHAWTHALKTKTLYYMLAL